MFWSVDEMFFKTPINDDLVKNKAIFTTRPDTIFGATFIAISPQHEFATNIIKKDKKI